MTTSKPVWEPTGAYSWALFAPPWWHGGHEYGPKSPEAYDKAVADYNASRAGGGLWDGGRRRVGMPTTPKGGDVSRAVTAFDFELLRQYVDSEGADGGQLDAFLCVVLQGMSVRAAAAKLGMSRSNVQTHLHRLQAKARRWQTYLSAQ